MASEDATQQNNNIPNFTEFGTEQTSVVLTREDTKRPDPRETLTSTASDSESRRQSPGILNMPATLQRNENRPEGFSSARPAPTRGILQEIYRNTLVFLSNIELREHDIPPGHQRVRWTNKRGRKLYDDYVEHEPGALQDMQNYLNTLAYQSRFESGTPPGLATSRSSTSLLQPRSSTLSDISSQRFQALIGISTGNYSPDDGEVGETTTSALHLFVCMEKEQYKVELYPESVEKITCDRELFRKLRNSYHQRRGRLRPYWSIRTFAYGGPRYVDARYHDELCGKGQSCSCIPPAAKVRPKGTEYECSPVPSKLSPPIGTQLMMDFFFDPDSIAPGSTLVTQQIPKRTSRELRSQSSDLTEAWGIYYKEGWHWVKIWWILAIGIFLPGLSFGITWGVLKRDIQGAVGIAISCMMGAANIVVILVGITGIYS
ncbi:hypothetical protein F5Y10DRAFT_289549 [Nemania abortiva]|nr:hypothetical protein F5Y10DRAFT_289549 [Nemania abortiva]